MGYFERFENIYLVHLIWCLPALVLLYYYNFRRKEKMLRKFATIEALKNISINVDTIKQKIKAVIILTAVFFIIIAAMRPQGFPTKENVKQSGYNIYP